MSPIRRSLRRLSCAALGIPPWRAPAPLPRSPVPASADVVIVGGGLTGLSAARALATAGREVVVLEQEFGTGATSRSGGIVLGETLVGPSPAFEGCDRSLREWIDASKVDCGLEWAGCLELIRDESLAPSPIDWRDEGTVRCSRHVEGGVLDPAKLLAGLAERAMTAGALLADESSVTAIEGRPDGVVLDTSGGTISARHVVLAMDATLSPGPADPWQQRAITVAMQTAPLEPEALGALGLAQHQAFYTDDLPLLWGRVMPDRSLLIGRETLPPLFDVPPEALAGRISEAGARLLARTRGLHPSVAHIDIRRVWGGPVARTSAGVPIFEPDPQMADVTWAGGYGGHGIAQAFRVGTLLAEQLLQR